MLTRRVGEVLYIGDVELTITGVKGNQVRLAMLAPDDVNIVRKEVRDRDRAAGGNDDS